MNKKKKVILCIFDGWGLSKKINYTFDASNKASTPNFDFIKKKISKFKIKSGWRGCWTSIWSNRKF